MNPNSKGRLDDLLREKRPDVLALIGPMPIAYSREILNRITRCNVKGSDLFDDAMKCYVVAMEKQKTPFA